MALWCRDLPTVSIVRGDAPKTITLVVPYYDQPIFLARQVAHWQTFNPALPWAVIVVDDGSPTAPIEVAIPDAPSWLRRFRIEVDVRWNWLAARNIGAHHAVSSWLLLTDLDHVVPRETWDAVIFGQHDPGVVYAFQRREHTGDPIAPHSASFLMTRALFWTIGGYDETLSGFYGTDGDWRRRVAAVAPIVLLSESLIRHEYVDDSSVRTYQRKQPEDAAVRQIVARRRPGWRPKTLSFPYHEVAHAS